MLYRKQSKGSYILPGNSLKDMEDCDLCSRRIIFTVLIKVKVTFCLTRTNFALPILYSQFFTQVAIKKVCSSDQREELNLIILPNII